MSTVLYIKANPKSDEDSRTFQISECFIKKYMEKNPEDEIITLDLYEEGIRFLTEEGVKSHSKKQTDGRNHPTLKYAYQFLEADKYVIAEPLWNLGIPAILKAYIDYICIAGLTFKYTESGPVGLCKGKKAINITTRGGSYSKKPSSDLEMGDRYLRTIFGFLGITDFTTIAADELDIVGQDVEEIMNKTIERTEEVAKNY